MWIATTALDLENRLNWTNMIHCHEMHFLVIYLFIYFIEVELIYNVVFGNLELVFYVCGSISVFYISLFVSFFSLSFRTACDRGHGLYRPTNLGWKSGCLTFMLCDFRGGPSPTACFPSSNDKLSPQKVL